MNDEVLDRVAEDIKKVENQIDRAEELLDAAQEAGEDVTSLRTRLQDLKMKRDRWVNMLKRRGYTLEG